MLTLLVASADAPVGCELSADAHQRTLRCADGTVVVRQRGDLAAWMKAQLQSSQQNVEDIAVNGKVLRGVRLKADPSRPGSGRGWVVQVSVQALPASVSCLGPDDAAVQSRCPGLVDYLMRSDPQPFSPFTAAAVGREPEVPRGCRSLDAASIDCVGASLRWGSLGQRRVETLLDAERSTPREWHLETYERDCLAAGAPTICHQLRLQSGERIRNVVVAATGPKREHFVECRVAGELPSDGPAPSVCGQAITFAR
jgi:hypothetical protein